MSRWWRAYDEAVDDPKLQRLPAEIFRSWFNICCLTSANKGVLPPLSDIAFKLRTTEEKVKKLLKALTDAGLLDETESGLQPHNWQNRQYKSDVSTDRVKRFRKRSKEQSETVSGNVPETETETETEKNKGEGRASALPYAFEGKVVKLRRKNFDDWVKAFPRLDLLGELTARDAWLSSARATDADRTNWFASTSQHLANRNMAAGAKVAALKPDGQPRRGIEGII